MPPYGFLQNVVGSLDVDLSYEACWNASHLTAVHRRTRFEIGDHVVGACHNPMWWRQADAAVRRRDEALHEDEVAVEPLVGAGVGWTLLPMVPADRDTQLVETAPVGPHVTESAVRGDDDAVEVTERIGLPRHHRPDKYGAEKAGVGFDPCAQC